MIRPSNLIYYCNEFPSQEKVVKKTLQTEYFSLAYGSCYLGIALVIALILCSCYGSL